MSALKVDSPKIHLPKGWAKASLGMVVWSSSAKAEPSENRKARYVGLEHIKSGESQLCGSGLASDIKSTKNKFLRGDILYGKLRPYLNKIALPDFDGICSTDILVLRPEEGVERGFIEAVMRAERFIEFATKSSSGINLPRTNFEKIAEFEFGLAPSKEQKRIADKLHGLLDRVRKLREQLDALPELIQQYRIAILEDACTGRLVPTEAELARKERRDFEPASVLLERILIERRAKWEADQLAKMRAAGKEPKDAKWKQRYREPQPPMVQPQHQISESSIWVSLDQLLYGIEAGKSFKCLPRVSSANEWGVIKVSAMSWGAFDESENKALPPGKRFDPHNEIRDGDILLSRSNTSELVGASVLVSKPRSKLLLSDKSMRLLPSSLVDRAWLQLAISSKGVRNQLSEVATGASGSMLNVSQEKVLQVGLILPPLSEQRRIVMESQRQLAAASAIDSLVADAAKNTADLRASLFCRAISGALVAQSNDDQPAEELLKQIAVAKEQRAMKKEKSKTKRRMKKSRTGKTRSQTEELFSVIEKNFSGKPFTFAQLAAHLTEDYESVKVEVFNLLATRKGRRLKQVFNSESAQMELQEVAS